MSIDRQSGYGRADGTSAPHQERRPSPGKSTLVESHYANDRNTRAAAEAAPDEAAPVEAEAQTPEASDPESASESGSDAWPEWENIDPLAAAEGSTNAAAFSNDAATESIDGTAESLFEDATSGAASSVPYLGEMEAAFGVPLGGVKAHLGAEAPLRAMNANAAASGQTVAFASQAPSRKDVAHELAHVQQSALYPGADAIQLSSMVGEPEATAEQEAEAVAHAIDAGERAPAITEAPSARIQRSFISFVVKMGAKKGTKGILKNFIKTQIKDRIKNLADKKLAKKFLEEADDILGILEDPWWVTAIGFIPIAGDAFDLVNTPAQIKRAIGRANNLEDKVKKALDAERQAQQAQRVVSTVGRRIPATRDLRAFADAKRVRSKTPVQGGGGLRERWKDSKGQIYEWDSQHGKVEMYDASGRRHLGEFDPSTGTQTKPPDPTRHVEP